MYKKIIPIALIIVLNLTIFAGGDLKEEYENVSYSGNNSNWSIEDASLMISEDHQVIDGGVLTYTGAKDIELNFIGVDIVDTNAKDKDEIMLHNLNQSYIDYASKMSTGDNQNLGGSDGNYYLNVKTPKKDNIYLAAKVTYSLANNSTIKTEIINLNVLAN